MKKNVYITEKPSVAQSFATVLNMEITKSDRFRGYAESDDAIISWCFGHLVNMAYPDAYTKEYKDWRIEHLPIIPEDYIYTVIDNTGIKKQYETINTIFNRADINTIYSCTDSGREGEYIFRLVYEKSKSTKPVKRVWISSYTEEAVLRGIKEAKDIEHYNPLSVAAYNRAKEDWLLGINLSRLYTCKYGYFLSSSLNEKKSSVIAIGRVMTCVLGLVAQRELEIKNFKPTKHFGVTADFITADTKIQYQGTWQPNKSDDEKDSDTEDKYIDKDTASNIINKTNNKQGKITKIENKTIKEKPPLLFNLAELQSEANKKFKLGVDKTLEIAQKLYEKKLITYPRTDCRVLSTDVVSELDKILNGLYKISEFKDYVSNINKSGVYSTLKKNKRYVDNKKVTDHYAIVPTYKSTNINSLDIDSQNIYRLIVKRFLAIFYEDAQYNSLKIETTVESELFISRLKALKVIGWKNIYDYSSKSNNSEDSSELNKLKKNENINIEKLNLDEKLTKPPTRYTDGSLILTMEKAGKLIEDEELREQIKTTGIGTSATRSGIIIKLKDIGYININKKTQVVTPSPKGESIFNLVKSTAKELLNPALTASWEKGLVMIENNQTTEEYFYNKLCEYVHKIVTKVKKSSYKI